MDKVKNKISKEDFEKYVSGWLFVTQDFRDDNLDMENMHAALANSLEMLYDDQAGIQAYVSSKFNQN